MNESRNINGWIFNKTNNLNSDGLQVFKATKKGVTLIGSREQILNSIKELEGDTDEPRD